MILKDATKLKIRENIEIIGCSQGTYVEETLKPAGYHALGFRGVLQLLPSGKDVPMMKTAEEIFNKYKGAPCIGVNYMCGILNGMVIEEALGRALDKVGYENLTPEAVFEALTTIDKLDTGGLSGPISFTDGGPGDRYGMSQVIILEVAETEPLEMVDVSDWIIPERS